MMWISLRDDSAEVLSHKDALRMITKMIKE